MMKISLVVAMGINNEIGANNDLLWHIPEDMKHFKRTTRYKTGLMGRKTYESIGRLLPDRKNIILTNQPRYKVEGAYVTDNIEYILKYWQDDIYVIGGQTIYEQFLPIADELIVTHVLQEYPHADVYFPEINYNQWRQIYHEDGIRTSFDEPEFTFAKYIRK